MIHYNIVKPSMPRSSVIFSVSPSFPPHRTCNSSPPHTWHTHCHLIFLVHLTCLNISKWYNTRVVIKSTIFDVSVQINAIKFVAVFSRKPSIGNRHTAVCGLPAVRLYGVEVATNWTECSDRPCSNLYSPALQCYSFRSFVILLSIWNLVSEK